MQKSVDKAANLLYNIIVKMGKYIYFKKGQVIQVKYKIYKAIFKMNTDGSVEKCLEYNVVGVAYGLANAFFVFDNYLTDEIEKLDLDEETAEGEPFNGIIENAIFWNKEGTMRYFYYIMKEADNE